MVNAVIEHAVHICQKAEQVAGLIATLQISGGRKFRPDREKSWLRPLYLDVRHSAIIFTH
jgi:hypothetical protein